MHVKKDDTVFVITGKDKGKKGRVIAAYPRQNRVLVEGVNMIKKHAKPSQANPQGGILTQEAPIHVSNVMLVDPKSGQPTRIGYKVLDSGKKSSRCEKIRRDYRLIEKVRKEVHKLMAARMKDRFLNEVTPALIQKFNYTTVMQVPKIEKVVINMGVGEAVSNSKVLDTAVSDLQLIAGQKPVITRAKKNPSQALNCVKICQSA